jgi:uncharacterized protein YrzB (UPF0473 family)
METFTIYQDGKEIEYSVLFTFYNEYLNKHFVVYTDQSQDDQGNLNLFVSSYDPTQEFSTLYPLSTKEEWEIASQAIEDFNNQVMETVDYDENDSSIEILPVGEDKIFEFNGIPYKILAEFENLDNQNKYILFSKANAPADAENIPVSIARIVMQNENGDITEIDSNLSDEELASISEAADSILESMNNQ